MVDVVGLAVGEHQQQVLALGLVGEFGRGMAHRRADARVVAGLQRGDAPLHGRSHRLVEALTVSTRTQERRRDVKVRIVMVAAGGKPMGEHEQRFLLHVENALAVDPASVESETSTRSVAARSCACGRMARWTRSSEPLPAAQIARGRGPAHRYRDRSVGLAAHHLMPRPQRLEPPPHLPDVPADGRSGAQASPFSGAGPVSTRQWSCR